MASDPEMMLRVASYHGISIRFVNGQLAAGPNKCISPEWVERLKRWRPIVGPHVAEHARIAETVRNVLTLSESDYQLWRVEVAAAEPDDPHIEHDRAALALVIRAKEIEALSEQGEAA